MGLWGAAQAIAFALGGLFGTAASDLARWLLGAPGAGLRLGVRCSRPLLFVAAAVLAARIGRRAGAESRAGATHPAAGDAAPACTLEVTR